MKSSTKQFYKAQKGMIMKMKFKKIIACFCLAAAAYGGPFVQDARYYEQYLPYQQQNDAVKLWADHDDSTRIPYVSYTAEEGDQRSKKMAVISFVFGNHVKRLCFFMCCRWRQNRDYETV